MRPRFRHVANGGPRNSTPHFAPNSFSASGSGRPFAMISRSSLKKAAASNPGVIRTSIRDGLSSMFVNRCVLPTGATTVSPACATTRLPSTSNRYRPRSTWKTCFPLVPMLRRPESGFVRARDERRLVLRRGWCDTHLDIDPDGGYGNKIVEFF